MYFQLFIRNSNFKNVQLSCDSWEEVIEYIEERLPKFCYIEYYDQDGLVGTAWKMRNFVSGLYETYKKISERNPEKNATHLRKRS